MLLRKFLPLLSVLFLGSCLPDEGDVSARYNRINQRAHIENMARSLATTAQNMTAYLTAAAMKRKTPLQNEGLIISDNPTDYTVMANDNPKPVPPVGVKVNTCGQYGAIAYFTEVPVGITSLKQNGSSMATFLVLRFGHEAVGLKTGNNVQLPRKAMALGCSVGNDILDGSPIFVAGFLPPKDSDGNIMEALPDPMKTTQPIFKRDITLPCPNGTDGVVKREQTCRLRFSDTETEQEQTKIKLGDNRDVENNVQRLKKAWECSPEDGAAQPPPTTNEVFIYCRDPANDITKQNDNAIELQVSSLRQELEANGPGYYSFYCRQNKDGSNTCDAKPFTPEPKTFLKCDKDLPPPRFVMNPYNPLQLNADGEMLGDSNEIRDCGRGWRGKMTARYLARRCQLMKTNVGGGTETVSTAQTIYRIGYAQAQCETNISTTTACPGNETLPGSDPSRRIPVTQHIVMLKPVALDWSETKPGPASWDTSKIAAPSPDSREEVLLSAGLEAPNKPKAVVPLITRAALDSLTGNAWSEALADAMFAADDKSIKRTITSCNNAGNPCGVPTPQKGIEIWVEGERRLWPYLGDAFNMDNLTCSLPPRERCNPILGRIQSMCGGGECRKTQVNPDLYVSGGNFEELINSYFSYVETPIPPGNAILRVAPATSVPLFNDPNALCDLASTDISNLMIFGTFKEGQAGFDGVKECPGLPGKTYLDSRDMFDDAINAYLARGGNLMIFTDHVKMGNENVPFFIEDISANIFRPDGKVTTTLQSWLTDVPPPGDPCAVIPKG